MWLILQISGTCFWVWLLYFCFFLRFCLGFGCGLTEFYDFGVEFGGGLGDFCNFRFEFDVALAFSMLLGLGLVVAFVIPMLRDWYWLFFFEFPDVGLSLIAAFMISVVLGLSLVVVFVMSAIWV